MDDKFMCTLSKEEVETIIQKKLGPSATVKTYKIEPKSKEYTGFLGIHLRLTITTTEDQEHHFFLKRQPKNKAHRDFAENTKAFYKEIELYNTLFEDLKNALDKTKKWRPEYYFSRHHEVLVVEDLSKQGYVMYPERKFLDDKHLEMCYKTIARMHAASFIFEEKLRKGNTTTKSPFYNMLDENVEIKHLYPNLMFETVHSEVPEHPGHKLTETGFKAAMELLNYVDGYSPDELKVIKERFMQELRQMYDFVKPSTKYKNIFLHGDLWTNNFMFRYDENGELEDAIAFDFQMTKYGPPAFDLMMFLYLVQTKEYRMKVKDHLLNYYYNELTKELAKYNISASDVLPKNEFLDSCKYYEKFGAVASCYYFQFCAMPPHLVEKLMTCDEYYEHCWFVDRNDLVVQSFLHDEENKKRNLDAMKEVIQTYIY